MDQVALQRTMLIINAATLARLKTIVGSIRIDIM